MIKPVGYLEISKQAKIDAEELARYKKADRDSELATATEKARIEGADAVYNEVMNKMDNSAYNIQNPIVEGSPYDIQMQKNIDNGLAYKQHNADVSLVDSVASRLKEKVGKGYDNVSDWFTKAIANADVQPHVQSDLQKSQEEEQIRYNSEQAGLAELKQILNRKQ